MHTKMESILRPGSAATSPRATRPGSPAPGPTALLETIQQRQWVWQHPKDSFVGAGTSPTRHSFPTTGPASSPCMPGSPGRGCYSWLSTTPVPPHSARMVSSQSLRSLSPRPSVATLAEPIVIPPTVVRTMRSATATSSASPARMTAAHTAPVPARLDASASVPSLFGRSTSAAAASSLHQAPQRDNSSGRVAPMICNARASADDTARLPTTILRAATAAPTTKEVTLSDCYHESAKRRSTPRSLSPRLSSRGIRSVRVGEEAGKDQSIGVDVRNGGSSSSTLDALDAAHPIAELVDQIVDELLLCPPATLRAIGWTHYLLKRRISNLILEAAKGTQAGGKQNHRGAVTGEELLTVAFHSTAAWSAFERAVNRACRDPRLRAKDRTDCCVGPDLEAELLAAVRLRMGLHATPSAPGSPRCSVGSAAEAGGGGSPEGGGGCGGNSVGKGACSSAVGISSKNGSRAGSLGSRARSSSEGRQHRRADSSSITEASGTAGLASLEPSPRARLVAESPASPDPATVAFAGLAGHCPSTKGPSPRSDAAPDRLINWGSACPTFGDAQPPLSPRPGSRLRSSPSVGSIHTLGEEAVCPAEPRAQGRARSESRGKATHRHNGLLARLSSRQPASGRHSRDSLNNTHKADDASDLFAAHERAPAKGNTRMGSKSVPSPTPSKSHQSRPSLLEILAAKEHRCRASGPPGSPSGQACGDGTGGSAVSSHGGGGGSGAAASGAAAGCDRVSGPVSGGVGAEEWDRSCDSGTSRAVKAAVLTRHDCAAQLEKGAAPRKGRRRQASQSRPRSLPPKASLLSVAEMRSPSPRFQVNRVGGVWR